MCIFAFFLVSHVALLQIIGLLVFYLKTDGGELGSSFFMCCCSVFALIVGGIVQFIHAKRVWNSRRQEYHSIN